MRQLLLSLLNLGAYWRPHARAIENLSLRLGSRRNSKGFSSGCLGRSYGESTSSASSAAVASTAQLLETTSPSIVTLRTPSILNGRLEDPLAPKRQPKTCVVIGVRSSIEYNDYIFTDNDNEDEVVAMLVMALGVNTGDFRKQEAAYLSAAYTATELAYINNTTEETVIHLLEAEDQQGRGKLTVPFTRQ